MRWLLKRWWFWTGTSFVLVALVAGYLLIPVGAVNQANCDRIRFGMTFEEVKSLLGDHYLGFEGSLVTWFDDDFDGDVINVFFNGERHEVIGKEFHNTATPFHERMKRRIERRIRALCP